MQPIYAQQLGVYSKKRANASEINSYISAIPRNYKYIAVNLNYNNIPDSSISAKMNANFQLDLNKDYNLLLSGYSSNTRRNLQKSDDLEIRFDGSLMELLKLKSENTSKNRRQIPLEKIRVFINTILEHNSGFICSAACNNQVCASVFFIKDQKRIYYIIPVSNPLGKEKKAMFAIIDKVIRKFAATPVILDFEGSNIAGIARFFEGFGAVSQAYPTIRINRMPFPLNKIKK
jgi:hypothetical protein